MYCFSKARRLVKKSDYNRVFDGANKTVTPDFVILHCANTCGRARIGLALSKKKIAKACLRNKVKRLLRENFRKQLLPPIDMVFLARYPMKKVETKTITANLETAWDKLITFYAR
ncbi:ribonuclease P protein component [Legionella dresdenensis]|uniref:Ribonuclease P protein component n=1 Tax=Legionella dresdenensis TaxID=450200 RepID=A0ABV8CE25_9GAMM